MSSVKVSISGAESLGDAFDVAVEETEAARAKGVAVELTQERGTIVAAIVLIATVAEPFVKEFVVKLLGRVAENLADRLAAKKKVEPFAVTVNDVTYNLPDDLDRMRKEQALA